jgi:hypothetical protein
MASNSEEKGNRPASVAGNRPASVAKRQKKGRRRRIVAKKRECSPPPKRNKMVGLPLKPTVVHYGRRSKDPAKKTRCKYHYYAHTVGFMKIRKDSVASNLFFDHLFVSTNPNPNPNPNPKSKSKSKSRSKSRSKSKSPSPNRSGGARVKGTNALSLNNLSNLEDDAENKNNELVVVQTAAPGAAKKVITAIRKMILTSYKHNQQKLDYYLELISRPYNVQFLLLQPVEKPNCEQRTRYYHYVGHFESTLDTDFPFDVLRSNQEHAKFLVEGARYYKIPARIRDQYQQFKSPNNNLKNFQDQFTWDSSGNTHKPPGNSLVRLVERFAVPFPVNDITIVRKSVWYYRAAKSFNKTGNPLLRLASAACKDYGRGARRRNVQERIRSRIERIPEYSVIRSINFSEVDLDNIYKAAKRYLPHHLPEEEDSSSDSDSDSENGDSDNSDNSDVDQDDE